jgi:hypothetical protein
MGLIDDILQGLPLNSLLREQMIQLKAEVAKLETENAILRDDLHQANAQIANHKKQTEGFISPNILMRTRKYFLIRSTFRLQKLNITSDACVNKNTFALDNLL